MSGLPALFGEWNVDRRAAVDEGPRRALARFSRSIPPPRADTGGGVPRRDPRRESHETDQNAKSEDCEKEADQEPEHEPAARRKGRPPGLTGHMGSQERERPGGQIRKGELIELGRRLEDFDPALDRLVLALRREKGSLVRQHVPFEIGGHRIPRALMSRNVVLEQVAALLDLLRGRRLVRGEGL